MGTILAQGVIMFMVLVTPKDGPLFFHYEAECVPGPVKTEFPVWITDGHHFRPWVEYPYQKDFVRLCEWRLGVNLVSDVPDPDMWSPPSRPRVFRYPDGHPRFDARTCNAVTKPDGWFDCPGA